MSTKNNYTFDCVATGIFTTNITIEADNEKEAIKLMKDKEENGYELYYDIVKMENLDGDGDESPTYELIDKEEKEDVHEFVKGKAINIVKEQ